MSFIADFHIHSKYSRATSKDMDIPHLDRAAIAKGVDLVGTGDFTHPLWRNHLKENLSPEENGLFTYGSTSFILTAEVSNIFYKAGETKKIHNLIFAPDFEVVEKISEKLEGFGDLYSDGRPILRLTAKDLVEIVLGVSEEAFVVPAHIWTPWFSLFGSNSGFNSIKECFEDYTDYIYALETGLSSDPQMNWRLSSLDRFILISNSDAHSPNRVGREANVFSHKLSYSEIKRVLKEKDKNNFLYTVEFFPQEGKYHWDGHRNCRVSLSPVQSQKYHNRCPACGKNLTIGVMHRVEFLADRKEGFIPSSSIPFKRTVPLKEIIAEVLQGSVETKKVQQIYEKIIYHLGGEIKVLLETPYEELKKFCPSLIAEGIKRVREGRVNIECGYDGVYGKVSIFGEEKKREKEQLSLF